MLHHEMVMILAALEEGVFLARQDHQRVAAPPVDHPNQPFSSASTA
ncbi:MAG: hypothetical protein P8Z81_01550 [Deinococcales bacterium]